MAALDAPRGYPVGNPTDRQDAYIRILNWEAMMTRRRGEPRLLRYRRAAEYYCFCQSKS